MMPSCNISFVLHHGNSVSPLKSVKLFEADVTSVEQLRSKVCAEIGVSKAEEPSFNLYLAKIERNEKYVVFDEVKSTENFIEGNWFRSLIILYVASDLYTNVGPLCQLSLRIPSSELGIDAFGNIGKVFNEVRSFKKDANTYYRAVMFSAIEQLFLSRNPERAFSSYAQFLNALRIPGGEPLQLLLVELSKEFCVNKTLISNPANSIMKFIFKVCTNQSLDKAIISICKGAISRLMANSASESSIIDQSNTKDKSFNFSAYVNRYLDERSNTPPDTHLMKSGVLFRALGLHGSLTDLFEEGNGRVCFYETYPNPFATVHLVRSGGLDHHYDVYHPTAKECDGRLSISMNSLLDALNSKPPAVDKFKKSLPDLKRNSLKAGGGTPDPAPRMSATANFDTARPSAVSVPLPPPPSAPMGPPIFKSLSKKSSTRFTIKSYVPLVTHNRGFCTFFTKFMNDACDLIESYQTDGEFDFKFSIVQSASTDSDVINRNVTEAFSLDPGVSHNWRYYKGDIIQDFLNSGRIAENYFTIHEVKKDLESNPSEKGLAPLTAVVREMVTVWIDLNEVLGSTEEINNSQILLRFLASFDTKIVCTVKDMIERISACHETFHFLNASNFTIDQSYLRNPSEPSSLLLNNIVDGDTIVIKKSKINISLFDGFCTSTANYEGYKRIDLEIDPKISFNQLLSECRRRCGVSDDKIFRLYLLNSNSPLSSLDELAIEGLQLRSKYCQIGFGMACERMAASQDLLFTSIDTRSETGDVVPKTFHYCDSCMNKFLRSQFKPRKTFYTFLPKPYPVGDARYEICTETVPSLFQSPLRPKEDESPSKVAFVPQIRTDIPCPFRGSPDVLIESSIYLSNAYMIDSNNFQYEFDSYWNLRPTVRCLLSDSVCFDEDYMYRGSEELLQLGCCHFFHKECIGGYMKNEINEKINTMAVPACPECKMQNKRNEDSGKCMCPWCFNPTTENFDGADLEPHRFTDTELTIGIGSCPDVRLESLEDWLEKNQIIVRNQAIMKIKEPNHVWFLCECERDGRYIPTNATFFDCAMCDQRKCVLCKKGYHGKTEASEAMTCEEAENIRQVRERLDIVNKAGILVRKCPRGTKCNHNVSLPINCRHATCEFNKECSFEYCFNCGAEYNSTTAHGPTWFHYPGCHYYEDCCEKKCTLNLVPALLPKTEGGVPYAVHIGISLNETQARSRCVSQPLHRPYRPGPCAACFEKPDLHNSCTHREYVCTDKKCIEARKLNGYFCRHYCKQCHYLGQACQPLIKPPTCEIIPEARIVEEYAKFNVGGGGGAAPVAAAGGGGGAAP